MRRKDDRQGVRMAHEPSPIPDDAVTTSTPIATLSSMPAHSRPRSRTISKALRAASSSPQRTRMKNAPACSPSPKQTTAACALKMPRYQLNSLTGFKPDSARPRWWGAPRRFGNAARGPRRRRDHLRHRCGSPSDAPPSEPVRNGPIVTDIRPAWNRKRLTGNHASSRQP